MIVDLINVNKEGLYSALYEQGTRIIIRSNRVTQLRRLAALDVAARAAGDHKDYPNELAKSRGNYQSALGAVIAKEL